jgi:hypothetical protein
LTVELVLGVSSGFLSPSSCPSCCVATAAGFDRLRGRHVALIAAAALVVSTFVPVIAAIREDRTGAIGAADAVGPATR